MGNKSSSPTDDPSLKTITDKLNTISSNFSDEVADRIMNPVGSPNYINKKNTNLQRILTDKRKNYLDAPLDLSLAEKNYYQYNNGKQGGNNIYDMTIIDRFANTANELKKNSIEKQQEFMANLTQALKQYQGQKMFAERTVELLQVREKEQEDLLKKLDMYERILQTSERKVVYEVKDTTSQRTYRRVMLFLYYSTVISYIIFGNFIPDKLYLNKMIWFILIIISLIPVILNLVIKWVFIIVDVLIYWFSHRSHKDILGELNED